MYRENTDKDLWLQCVVYMLLAVYLDKVLPDRMGVRALPPWYPLLPSYWTPRKVWQDLPFQLPQYGLFDLRQWLQAMNVFKAKPLNLMQLL